MLSIQVVLFDGFDLMDAIAPYEVFSAAAMYTDHQLNLQFVTAEGPRTVASGIQDVKLEAIGRLDPETADIIVIPGASGPLEEDHPDSVPVRLSKAMQTELTPLAQQALEREHCIVATVCGGSLILAMNGLLEGRPAVTNHLGMELLAATGAIPINARVVDDGNLVSGGGVTSGLDVALYLVERVLGPRTAHAVEQLFEFERRGTVWRDTSSIRPTLNAANLLKPDMHSLQNVTSEAASAKHNERPPIVKHKQAVEPPTHKLLQEEDAAAFIGDWDTTIATPIGKLQVRLSIMLMDGIVQGTATQGNETVPFIDPMLDGNRLVWSLRITKPMRLNLKFEAFVDGNAIHGNAKAGLLPSSKLTGVRIV
ncbi:DJ-1/PfpI family protein [Paenibacillus septentrionalis]|uniref:DJ-1/PfpI family protein n=1 Tax=Paenibacillus septentrionalis TaxID=429342 RepID=A0ABW1V7L3_9BACL